MLFDAPVVQLNAVKSTSVAIKTSAPDPLIETVCVSPSVTRLVASLVAQVKRVLYPVAFVRPFSVPTLSILTNLFTKAIRKTPVR